jgi:hypothetical protein
MPSFGLYYRIYPNDVSNFVHVRLLYYLLNTKSLLAVALASGRAYRAGQTEVSDDKEHVGSPGRWLCGRLVTSPLGPRHSSRG